MIRSTIALSVCFGSLLFHSVGFADQMELQNQHSGFEGSNQSWIAYPSTLNHEYKTRDWSTAEVTGRETGIGQKFLKINGSGSVAQFVALNQQSPYQILSAMAFRESTNGSQPGWCGVGLVYYDASWNEVRSDWMVIGDRGVSNRGNGDGLVPYSMGVNVPSGAVFVGIILYNAGNGTKLWADKVELVNYFTESNYTYDPSRPFGDRYTATAPQGRNLLLNGDFETQYSREEFWAVNEGEDTVSVDTYHSDRLQMGGEIPNMISQEIQGIRPGTTYTLSVDYVRPQRYGSNAAFALAGIDFLDSNDQEIEEVTATLNNTSPTANTHETSVTFTTPSNMQYARLWVWMDGQANPTAVPLVLDGISIREQSGNPGTIRLSTDAVSFDENIGDVGVAIFRTGGSDGRVTIDYTTRTGTAGNSDFQSISGTLVFEDGVTDRFLTIAITDDSIDESDETFEVRLSNPTGGASLGLAVEELTIRDDDVTVTGYLPDMVVVPSTLGEQLRIDRNQLPGRDLLRFSTEVANIGDGPLELYGGATSGDSQVVLQRIYRSGGFQDVVGGEFVFHPAHGHIHFEGFATYDLVNDNGQVVASGGKTSFCLVNIRQPFPFISSAASLTHGRGGNSCGQIQGISAGYSDVYSSSLPDQWIDITNVPDGNYWLRVTADPDNALREENDNNNSDQIRIRLRNGSVSQI